MTNRAWSLAVAVTLAFADVSIVVLGLPSIYGEFDTSIVEVSWVITVYAVVVGLAGLTLTAWRGRPSAWMVTIAGVAVSAAAALACGLAPSMTWLLASRGVQGLGTALLLSGTLDLLEADQGRRAGRSLWALAATVGLAIGPALGGALTQAFDWRAIFLAQAPVAAAAGLLGTMGQREAATTPDAATTPGGTVRLAVVALVLLSGALVGALFLGVLLVIEVWRYSPIAGAVVVSTLPGGLFLMRPLRQVVSPRPRVVAGCTLLAAGLAGLALLPSPSAWWAAAALGLCGAGFGLVDPVLGDLALGGAGSSLRNGARDVAARHLGLVLGLALIAPALSSDLQAGTERAVLAGADTMLDARLEVQDKVGVAQAVGRLVERTPRGHMPDITIAFGDAGVSGEDADRAAADLVTRIEMVLTRSFRRGLLLAAGLALATLLPGLLATRGTAESPAPRRRGALALTAVVGLAGAFLAGTLAAGGRDAGEFSEADACEASPDPYSGRGFDATVQRIALGGLNGAACELGVSRERLVLSLADVPGIGSVPLDRGKVEEAMEAGLLRAIDDADDRGSLPGWAASALRFVARRTPMSWVLNGLDLADLSPI